MSKKTETKPIKITRNNWIIIIILMVLIFVLVYFLSLQYKKQTTPKQPQTDAAQLTMPRKEYSDTTQTYAIKVPEIWRHTETIMANTTGLGTVNQKQQKVEVHSYTAPSRAGITIQRYEGTPVCTAYPKPTTQIGGMPASYDVTHHAWTILTTDAVYKVQYAYPGLPNIGGKPRMVKRTQPTKQQMDIDQKLIESILSSFKLTKSQSLSC